MTKTRRRPNSALPLRIRTLSFGRANVPPACHILLLLCCFLCLPGQPLLADYSPSPGLDTGSVAPSETQAEPDVPSATPDAPNDSTEKGEETPTLFRGYWQQGLILENPNKRFKFKLGGKFIVDGGYIASGAELQAAYPDLPGWAWTFRSLTLTLSGDFWERIEFKVSVDFANVQDVKDQWIRFPTIPVVKHMVFGHVKQPVSLEELGSLNELTFMERSLPNEVFVPGRDIGILTGNLLGAQEGMTWRLGAFLNTGSFQFVGDERDQIGQANGYDLSMRVTGLPRYRDDGTHLLHLGLSANYRNRHTITGDSTMQFQTRPETHLTDDRLISTGLINADSAIILDPEIAIVEGPFSLQGEFFYARVQAEDALTFWGGYLHGSVFLTGEHRIYNASGGTFSRVTPYHEFRPLAGKGFGEGALEAGLRYSIVDLNDKHFQGGQEENLTVGLNWYTRANIRWMVNYIHVRVKDRADPPIDDDTAHILQARIQIYL